MNQRELLSMPEGTLVDPREVFAGELNYVLRADRVHALRQRLNRLTERGEFRKVGDDEWRREREPSPEHVGRFALIAQCLFCKHEADVSGAADVPMCPKCFSPMVVREAKAE